MKPQPMVVMHEPELQHFGDCARACIASVLELLPSDVPHFYHDGNGENGHNRMQEYLRTHGIYLVQIPLESKRGDQDVKLDYALEIADYWIEGNSHYMLGGTSETGCDHFVICKGTEIVHNPGTAKIIGPQDDGYWWIGIFGKVL